MIECPRPKFRGLRCLATCALALGLGTGQGQTLPLAAALPPGTEQTASRVERLGSYGLPIGPWSEGSMLTRQTEGRVEQSAWRIPQPDMGTLELLAPLRSALEGQGWRLMFECETTSCGGFDFRYSTQVLPEPGMHVDLGDFRFLSARKGMGGAEEHISLLVSRSTGAGAGYVQMIQIGPPDITPRPPTTEPQPAGPTIAAPAASSGVWAALESGSVILEGLEFATGAADTALGADELLAALAAYLVANPTRTLGLVGHTDASGSLDINVSLSRRRAESVRKRLVDHHGVPAERVIALGAGFMAPRSSNLTEDGRTKNRRVEAILTSTR